MTPAPKDPEMRAAWIKKLCDATTKQMQDPSMRYRISELHKGRKHTEEEKRKIGESLKGKIHWPNGRPEMLGDKNPSCRPEVKMKKSLKMKGRRGISRYGKDNSMYGKKASEATKLKMSISHRGEKCYLWKGGISFEPYCIKFNRDFKKRVRAFFSNTCVECGTPENHTKLHVHHVNFNKKACCDKSVIPLFVLLCNSCHGKTHVDRDYWESYFTDIIRDYYGGKCYFTKEEFQCLYN
jgi:hypothetical protein